MNSTQNTYYSPLRNTQQQSQFRTSPCTPAENRAAYIAHLNSANTNFKNVSSNVKKITELEIGKW